MTLVATAAGHFDVALTPVEPGDPALPAMTIAKTFRGDLTGTSTGSMLSVTTATPGSAGYVAMERVTGTLGGRQGGFVLMHRGVLDRGAATLSVTVVPDSGTGALAGLSGTMDIDAAADHAYTFRYALPDR